MKKISLILLALFLLQGSENCEAGPYEMRMAEIAARQKQEQKKPQPDVPNQDEEQKKKQELEKEEAEKKSKIEAAEKEEAEKKAAIEEVEKKIYTELEKEFDTLKTENDIKDTELAGYKAGTLPKEIADEISAMDLDRFYTKKNINTLIKQHLTSDTSSATSSNKFQSALKALGIPNNDSGLKALQMQKTHYTKKLEALKAKNSAQDTLALEAQELALRRVLNAVEQVADKDFSIEVLKKAAQDVSVPSEIKNLFHQISTDINDLANWNDAAARIKVKNALKPLGIAVQKALEDVTKNLANADKDRQEEENMTKLISNLSQIEDFIVQEKAKNSSKMKKLNAMKRKGFTSRNNKKRV